MNRRKARLHRHFPAILLTSLYLCLAAAPADSYRKFSTPVKRVQGIIQCRLESLQPTGEITFSLLQLTGEKIFDRKCSWNVGQAVPSCLLLGGQPNTTYIVEAEGALQSGPYSRACKVRTDEQGNAAAQFTTR